MRTATLISGIALSLVIGGAQATEGEFGKQCAMGLAMGKRVDTDCKVNWQDKDSKTYCFGDENSKAMFMKDPAGNLEKAKSFMAGQHR